MASTDSLADWRQVRLRRAPRTVLVVLTLAVAASGCGNGQVARGTGQATTVDVTYSAGGQTKKQTLDCATPTPNDKPSCALLAELPSSAFELTADDAVCTMIFGGPELATIKGTVNGRKVDAKYSRSNGCEIARWNKVEPIFAEMAGN